MNKLFKAVFIALIPGAALYGQDNPDNRGSFTLARGVRGFTSPAVVLRDSYENLKKQELAARVEKAQLLIDQEKEKQLALVKQLIAENERKIQAADEQALREQIAYLEKQLGII
jgi:hypothetical protein